MNDNYIRCECLDIFDSLELFDSLKFAHNLLELVYCSIYNEIETEEDKKEFDDLGEIISKLHDIIKNNDKE